MSKSCDKKRAHGDQPGLWVLNCLAAGHREEIKTSPIENHNN